MKNSLLAAIAIIILFGIGFYFYEKTDFNQSHPMNQIQPQKESQNQTVAAENKINNQINMENKTTGDGLQIQILKQGTGESAKKGDTVTVNYVGTLTNGTKFDSSIDRGQPFSFILGAEQVIKGWDKGVLGMKVGEVRKLIIPPELGYGSNTVGPIPANSTLVFEVTLLKIN